MQLQFLKPRKIQRSVQIGGDMSALEWLRALINNKPWEYCVIWKLGNDPSRFIEWGACCCSGGNIKIKDENDYLIGECKDKFVKHQIRSKACTKLAQLPSVIPLYSGIHGDVVISKQSSWAASASDSDLNGTQVLVPVSCGLIELFSTKNVPKDQKLIDYISAPFKLSLKQENMTENMFFSSLHCINVHQPNNYSSLEGSSTCTSSLSNDQQLLKVGSDLVQVLGGMSLDKSSKQHVDVKNTRKRKKYTEFALVHGNENADVKNRHKVEKGPYTSKNLVTERNRRKRIKDGMFALRALVPKITKMDRAATLGDAADYIKELEETIQNLRNELKIMDEDESDNVTANAKTYMTKLINDSANKKTPIEVQVEVNQLGPKDFLLKLICNETRGGFSRLIEGIETLGLQVVDANVATFNGCVMNVLKLEANRSKVEPNALKRLLLQLVK